MSDPIDHLEDYAAGPRHRATVISNRWITPEGAYVEVRELVLDVDRPDFPFEVGQSIGVFVPGSPEHGPHEHFRLYSVADLPERGEQGRPRIEICVRRCSYVDGYSGERFPGVASNFLCDRKPGDSFEVTGPFGLAFEVPDDPDATLILIGSGTGIAPFRAFVKHLYRDAPDFRGRVWLFYGANSGLELLYMNEEHDDFAQYYDRETFEAFRALSPRPNWADPIAWDEALQERGQDIFDRLGHPSTYVYLAGLEESLEGLDAVFARMAGSAEKWERRKAELAAGGRWRELVY